MKTTLILLIATLVVGVVLGPLAMEALQTPAAADTAALASPQGAEGAEAAPSDNASADANGEADEEDENDEDEDEDEDKDDK